MPTRVSTENNLKFLNNKELEKIIEDSIQYIQIILKEAEDSKSALYKEETYRVIVLYVISIIEAILLGILELRKEKITSIDYKRVSYVDPKFKHTDLPDDPVVIAIQKKVNKNNERIGFVELVNFVKNNSVILETTAEELKDINSIRNTFHFTKPRNEITCEIKTVEKAFELLVRIIEEGTEAIAPEK